MNNMLNDYLIDPQLTEDAFNRVGDGKTPNVFYVSIGSDAYEADFETPIKLIKGDSISGVTRSFLDLDEAIEFARSIPMHGEMHWSVIGSVLVEDRLNGVILVRKSVREDFSIVENQMSAVINS